MRIMNNGNFLARLCAFALGLIVLFCLCSCGAQRGVLTAQKDSVRTVISERVIYRDTVIHVPVPAESDKAVLRDTDTSLLQTSLAVSEAWVSDGNLHHTLRNRSDSVRIVPIKIPEKRRNIEQYNFQTRTVTVEVERELTRWQKFIQSLGLGAFVAACAAILYLAIRIIRRFLS